MSDPDASSNPACSSTPPRNSLPDIPPPKQRERRGRPAARRGKTSADSSTQMKESNSSNDEVLDTNHGNHSPEPTPASEANKASAMNGVSDEDSVVEFTAKRTRLTDSCDSEEFDNDCARVRPGKVSDVSRRENESEMPDENSSCIRPTRKRAEKPRTHSSSEPRTHSSSEPRTHSSREENDSDGEFHSRSGLTGAQNSLTLSNVTKYNSDENLASDAGHKRRKRRLSKPSARAAMSDEYSDAKDDSPTSTNTRLTDKCDKKSPDLVAAEQYHSEQHHNETDSTDSENSSTADTGEKGVRAKRYFTGKNKGESDGIQRDTEPYDTEQSDNDNNPCDIEPEPQSTEIAELSDKLRDAEPERTEISTGKEFGDIDMEGDSVTCCTDQSTDTPTRSRLSEFEDHEAPDPEPEPQSTEISELSDIDMVLSLTDTSIEKPTRSMVSEFGDHEAPDPDVTMEEATGTSVTAVENKRSEAEKKQEIGTSSGFQDSKDSGVGVSRKTKHPVRQGDATDSQTSDSDDAFRENSPVRSVASRRVKPQKERDAEVSESEDVSHENCAETSRASKPLKERDAKDSGTQGAKDSGARDSRKAKLKQRNSTARDREEAFRENSPVISSASGTVKALKERDSEGSDSDAVSRENCPVRSVASRIVKERETKDSGSSESDVFRDESPERSRVSRKTKCVLRRKDSNYSGERDWEVFREESPVRSATRRTKRSRDRDSLVLDESDLYGKNISRRNRSTAKSGRSRSVDREITGILRRRDPNPGRSRSQDREISGILRRKGKEHGQKRKKDSRDQDSFVLKELDLYEKNISRRNQSTGRSRSQDREITGILRRRDREHSGKRKKDSRKKRVSFPDSISHRSKSAPPERTAARSGKKIPASKIKSSKRSKGERKEGTTSREIKRCDVCGYETAHEGMMRRHSRSHNPCKFCDQVFKRTDTLKRHVREKHGKPDSKYTCRQCDKSFSRKEHLDRHKRSHSGKNCLKCTFQHHKKTIKRLKLAKRSVKIDSDDDEIKRARSLPF